jgi:hypothetical protein
MLLFLHITPEYVFDKIIGPLLLMPANKSNPLRNRVPTFRYAISVLGKKDNPIIVETGCSRKDHGLLAWGDDGCSTFLFDIFTLPNQGKLFSVDMSPENAAHSESKTSSRVSVTCADSVDYLESLESAHEIDLLYLDSYDFDPDDPNPSQSHHLKEISAIYSKLKPGCLILVDDAGVQSSNTLLGKAGEVFKFMEARGIHPTISDYQILWTKPQE